MSLAFERSNFEDTTITPEDTIDDISSHIGERQYQKEKNAADTISPEEKYTVKEKEIDNTTVTPESTTKRKPPPPRPNVPKKDPTDEPITTQINYRKYKNFWASVSQTAQDDYREEHYVLNYEKYASSFNEFCKRYPTITIETRGEAISKCTFGDVGKGKFGKLTYSTKTFTYLNDKNIVYMVHIYDAKSSAFEVQVKIGIVFEKRNTNLYLKPFITGKLYSVGIKRYLDFGLHVLGVTFNPKTQLAIERMTGKSNLKDERIVCNINYDNFQHTWATSSNATEHVDYKSEYFLLDYEDYASSFQEFCRRYPTVTIETDGVAKSTDTFGDIGKYKFGTLTYNTNNFSVDPMYIYMVDKKDYGFWAYEVNVRIGIGFIKRDTALYLNPFLSGTLKSHGGWERWTYFGLKISKLTFNSKN